MIEGEQIACVSVYAVHVTLFLFISVLKGPP